MSGPTARAQPSNGGESINVEEPRLVAIKHEQKTRIRFPPPRQFMELAPGPGSP